MRNRVGNVPTQWYKDEQHVGYDVTGEKIIRKNKPDALEEHIARQEDPEWWCVEL